ncbi:MAG: hypothetical protein PVJ67_06410 [Candidatus Pacearchaeota archaeon]|jgi:hypothetical protein
MEKFFENLQSAEKIIFSCDHLLYVVFPLVKDKKILLKILTDTKDAIAKCINSILQYEYIYKKIKLYKTPEENFKVFKEKSASRFGIDKKEISLIINLFDLIDFHEKSSMEFIKDGKIVILSEGMKSETVSVKKIREFLNLSKKILKEAKFVILS